MSLMEIVNGPDALHLGVSLVSEVDHARLLRFAVAVREVSGTVETGSVYLKLDSLRRHGHGEWTFTGQLVNDPDRRVRMVGHYSTITRMGALSEEGNSSLNRLLTRTMLSA